MTAKTIIIAKDVDTGKPITTTVKDIVSNRILWEGDSGSGKSHGMTTMIEGTDVEAQRIVIDPEGEYFTLKNNFKFLLVGRKTETIKPDYTLDTNDVNIDKLVLKIVEHGIDTIFDLSEVPEDAAHFFKIFQKSLFKYAKFMKKPIIVFVDEAQIFAPEKGQGDEESLKSMKQLAKRGRKRAIGLVCGTQAIADFSKDIVRQLRTRFIGNCTYDNDVKSAAQFLRFPKTRESELRELADDNQHHFFVGGKGYKIGGKSPKEVSKIECIENKTELYKFEFSKKIKLNSKHSMKEELVNFDDIPSMIQEELSEKETLQKDNIDLRKTVQDQKVKIIQAERTIKSDPRALDAAYQKGITQGKKTIDALTKYIMAIKNDAKAIKMFIAEMDSKADKKFSLILETGPIIPDEKPSTATIFTSPVITPPTQSSVTIGDPLSSPSSLTGPETKVLIAILQCPGYSGTKRRIALYCNYAMGGGAFGNIKGSLKSKGFITYEGDELVATPEGIAMIPTYPQLPTDPSEVIRFWTEKLGAAKGKVLKCIYEEGEISKDDVATQCNYTPGTGAINNILGALRTLGLIDYLADKKVAIAKELMPMLA